MNPVWHSFSLFGGIDLNKFWRFGFIVAALIVGFGAGLLTVRMSGGSLMGLTPIKICELPPDKARYQLAKNQEIIEKNGAPHQLFFRPPYGALDPASVNLIGKQGYKIILWTIDSLDWRGLKKWQVISNVTPNIKQGYIVLQHSASESKLEDLTGTIDALPEIIKTAKNRGYRFITIPQLIAENSK